MSPESREKMRKNHADFNGDKNPFWNRKHTDAVKEISSKANTGVDRFSDEMKIKLSVKNSGRGNPFYGKTHTIETINLLKKPKSKEHCKNLSIASKGRKSYFIGKKHTPESKRKMRISAINRMKRVHGETTFQPNVNINESVYFKNLESKMGWNGIYHGKNEAKQFYVENLGYFVDYYEPTHNIVVEYDETNHYDKNWNLREKDIYRQNEIKSYLNCKFYRYNSPLDKFYEV